jgi:hypothetical protein
MTSSFIPLTAVLASLAKDEVRPPPTAARLPFIAHFNEDESVTTGEAGKVGERVSGGAGLGKGAK